MTRFTHKQILICFGFALFLTTIALTLLLWTRVYNLYNRGVRLQYEFIEAVYNHDYDVARTLLEKYDAWEKKFNATKEKEYADKQKKWYKTHKTSYPLRKVQNYASSYYHEILYEVNKDWNNALLSIQEYSQYNERICDRDDFLGVANVEAIIARLHFKMGLAEQAYVDYCLIARTINLKIEKRRLRSMYSLNQSEHDTHDPTVFLSCFPTYADFLSFMEEEYAKLGSPEEYREAMEIYRALDEEERPTETKARPRP